MSAAVQMLVAGAALTLVGTARASGRRFSFSARTLGAFAYLVVFGSLVAYSAYTYAIQNLPLSLVSTYSYVNPVIAVLLGWLLLGEPMGWRVVAATAVILSGVALVKAAQHREGEAAKRGGEAVRSENGEAGGASGRSRSPPRPRRRSVPRGERHES